MTAIKYLRVSVTTDCNEKCWYCYNEGLEKNKIFLTNLDDFEWLIGKVISHYGVEIIRFTGGEPLLNRRIVDIIEIIKKNKPKSIGLTTNGAFLRDYYKKINALTPVNYSVHLHQIDTIANCGMDEVVRIISETRKLVKNARFNIVLTKKNLELVRQIARYSIDNNINLLLLELLQAQNDFDVFLENHCSLSEIKDTLHEYKLSCTQQNKNSHIYTNGKMSIKVVDNYVSVSDKKMHNILHKNA